MTKRNVKSEDVTLPGLILWTLLYHGYLMRTFDWAARSTQAALARSIAEGMRSHPLPQILPAPGQLRFVT